MKRVLTYKKFIEFNSLFESINADGTCYVDAFKYFQDNHFKNKRLRLVHGLVDGQGALTGITYNHAWVEDGNKIIDMTLPPQYQKSLTKKQYYKIGNIKTTFSYDSKEFMENVLKFETYGPWEEKLIKNKY